MEKRIDNEKKYNILIKKFYDSIFKLDTKTLLQFYTEIYKELISRDDFCQIDDLKVTYEIIKDELIERGVTNV